MATKRKRKTRLWRRPRQLNPGLRLAVEASGGTMAALARKLKLTPQAISQWNKVPLNWLFKVERITKVKREQLRPDLYRKSAR